MKFYYPVVVSKNENGKYHAVFPDLAMCEADGISMDDVLYEATLAAHDWIESEMLEEEPDLPFATDPSDIELAEGEETRMILVNLKLMPGFEE
ncbi:MAG: type II toxin-antitoxin system HicB family antitoxin [Bilifractor sp.]|jgi:predicted RNase H-like HicB family nuclease